MNFDNRGQAAVTPLGTLVTMCVAFVVGYIGLEVMREASERASPEEMETVCQGAFGCGSPPMWGELFLLAAGISIAAVAVGFILRSWKGHGIGAGTEPRPRLQVVKEQYVEGDIDTVLSLEDRLEDVLDDGSEVDDE